VATAICSALLSVLAASRASAAPSFTVAASVRQLIVVSSRSDDPPGEIASLSAYERPAARAPWEQAIAPMPAEIGDSGLRSERAEGDGSTPTGVYSIGSRMFGNEANPGGLHYPYVRLRCGDWWDEDPYTPLYNRFVARRCGSTPAFASWSEPLWTETHAYPYFAVIDFNTRPVRGGAGAPGSGIFLHSWVGGPTAGCVAVHEQALLTLLRWLRSSANPQVAIGTNAELRATNSDIQHLTLWPTAGPYGHVTNDLAPNAGRLTQQTHRFQ
jgi:L,D-peptidoglycan transpeptidase YkuD (ErfK/YbiS/YcfS/YnhG family)